MLRVNDIFETISGEAGGYPQGTWVSGIRLQECNLHCAYCDTPQAQEKEHGEYTLMSPEEILSLTRCKHVLLTGGEPLLQAKAIDLIELLVDAGKVVQVETNGSIQIPSCYGNVQWVIDRKGPSSGMESRMMKLTDLVTNAERARHNGGDVYLKWVISTFKDIDHAIREMKALECTRFKGSYILSPMDAKGDIIPVIASSIRQEDPDLLDKVTFSVQIHKLCKLP